MPKKIDISLKKIAKQQRAIATVDAIIEAATYILKQKGPNGFTANKVAEKAGVNIASFYQYFPNKEALLFHIVKMNWEKQFARLLPILSQSGLSHAKRLKDLIREFFMIEAEEADLRQALRIASIELKDTKEFKALMAKGGKVMGGFLEDALKGRSRANLDFDIDFMGLLMTSFAERATDERTPNAILMRQADLLSDMLIAHFKIS